MTLQRHLPLTVPATATFLDMGAVRALLRVDDATVREMVEDGRLRWCWDLANAGGERRLFRFWAHDVARRQNAAGTDNFEPDQVIDLLWSPNRVRWGVSTLARELLVTRSHIHTFLKTGELTGERDGHAQFVWRESLVDLFKRRLVQ